MNVNHQCWPEVGVVEGLGRPYVVGKVAISLDGKLAMANRQTALISNAQSRLMGHGLRRKCAAIMIGLNTALADNPLLNVRDGLSETAQPARIILDSRLRIPLDSRCLSADGAQRIVVCGTKASQQRRAQLVERGVSIIDCPTEQPQAADYLPKFLEQGLRSVLVEGGAKVYAHLIKSRLIDELYLFVAPLILGDEHISWCARLGLKDIDEAQRLKLEQHTDIAGDALLRLRFG